MLHFRWDLDKTYIHTEFDSLRDLVRTFRQSADEKRSVAGAPTLLRELLTGDEEPRRVTFISGSPRQMRRVLTEKLRLDGIEPDVLVLKPNLSNLLRLRFKALNDQLGYKLGALMASRFGGAEVREVLFGDDSESDALIYSMYADLLSGALDRATFERALRASRAYRSDVDELLRLYDGLGTDVPTVERVFIHLDRRSPTARFDLFGRRVVPVYNYFQAAVVLFGMDMLDVGALVRVTESMGHSGYTPARLANSMQDLERRGFVDQRTLRATRAALADADRLLGYPASLFLDEFGDALATVQAGSRELPWVGDIDYVAAVAETGRYRRVRRVLQSIGPLRD